MELDERAQILDHAWKYFQIHADQRIKTFHFYLIICALISGALTAILEDASDLRIGIPLALLLPFLSFVFWKLDHRNKQLIAHAEQALRYIENEFSITGHDGNHILLKIFNCENRATSKLKIRSFCFTYSTCFHLVFLTFGISGIVISYLLCGKPSP